MLAIRLICFGGFLCNAKGKKIILILKKGFWLLVVCVTFMHTVARCFFFKQTVSICILLKMNTPQSN